MKNNVLFNHIIILQSLSPEDEKTGEELFQHLTFLHYQPPYFTLEIQYLNNINDFNTVIEKLDTKISHGIIPLLHFEMHGSPQGLVFSNHNTISWLQLINALRRINILTKNNLFITLSSCFGAYLQKYIDVRLPSPFYGFIGAVHEVNAHSLHCDFKGFYGTLMETMSFDLAIEELNKNQVDLGVEYNYSNCYSFFDALIEVQFSNERLKHEGLENKELKLLLSEMKQNYCQDNQI